VGLVDHRHRRRRPAHRGQRVGPRQLLRRHEQVLEPAGGQALERLGPGSLTGDGVDLHGVADVLSRQPRDLVALRATRGDTTTVGPGVAAATSL
jgi:hypothetical protein